MHVSSEDCLGNIKSLPIATFTIAKKVADISIFSNILIMSDHTSGRSLFLGTFIHSKSLNDLEYLQKTAVLVDEKGVIVAVEPNCDQTKAEELLYPKLGWSREHVVVRTAKAGQFFFPGFIGLS